MVKTDELHPLSSPGAPMGLSMLVAVFFCCLTIADSNADQFVNAQETPPAASGKSMTEPLSPVGESPPSSVTPESTSSAKSDDRWPTWLRYVVWVLAGFFAATAVGMLLNKRPGGLIFVMVFVAMAARSISRSWESGETIWPPVVCLVMMVLFGGAGRMANREYLESQSTSDTDRSQ